MEQAVSYSVDASEVLKMMKDLDFTKGEMKRALSRGLATSAALIRNETKSQLKNVAYKNGPLRNADFLAKGISIGLWKSKKGATVGLFTKKKSIGYKGGKFKNPSFILRWIELGTAERKTSKGYNRGEMEEKRFFQKAVAAKKQEAEASLKDNIEKAIKKIAERKEK